MERLGWTPQTIAPGQRITIKGSPARREENVCLLISFVRQDGVEVRRMEDLAKGVNPLAQLSKTAPRPARLPNGQPNISGFWLAEGGPFGGPGRAEPTPEGELAAKRSSAIRRTSFSAGSTTAT